MAPLHWSTFSRSQILKCEYHEKGECEQKMLKYFDNIQCYRGWNFPSNETTTNVVVHDLDLNFQGQTFQVAILTSKCWKNCKHYHCHQIGSRAFSNEWHHFECCTSWTWPTFSRSQIFNVNISKMVRANEKCSRMTFIEVDICQNRTISNVVLHDLDLHFQGQTFQVAIWQGWKTANITTAIRQEVRHLPLNGATANVVCYDPDLHFQGHKFKIMNFWFWNVNISKTVRASENCSSMTDIIL